MPQGQLFVISAPSGAGKTSLVAATIARVSDLTVSVSHTTRSPRPGEVDGRDYHFVDQSEFDALIASQALFEHAQVFGNFYGTSKEAIESQLASGIDVILEIDWQGASQVRMMAPDAVSIFILPPTRDALRERLIGRQQDDSTIIDARMAEADETIEQAPHFDYWVINDDFEMALGQLKSIIISHRQRRPQIQAKHPNFLEKLLGHQ
ncbi:guanylate kinase [Litorivicinus sp.]|jgi:guanylate kinase|nr:guanylate kinase [Litorivicinus sp.]MCH1501274.1 guanylate kinase [Litorivicinaceae bacterium]MDA0893733.1 guanylate kinase [Pseudomonadota bacterium]HAB78534.1 guanylate kinase [Gammaproteobacteria bacterium]MBL6809800.1 guanylate kinase [Litorivicinus sp.]